MNEEPNNEEGQIINEDKNIEKKLKLKMIFNEEELSRKARKEIAFIRKKIKAKKKELHKAKKQYNKIKKYYVKKGKKYESLDLKYKTKANKNIEIENYKFIVN